jgi:hypothetical protein
MGEWGGDLVANDVRQALPEEGVEAGAARFGVLSRQRPPGFCRCSPRGPALSSQCSRRNASIRQSDARRWR